MAESDPERMMAETDAWRSRQLNVKEFALQRPLYNITTYTDSQVRHDNIHPPATFMSCSVQLYYTVYLQFLMFLLQSLPSFWSIYV